MSAVLELPESNTLSISSQMDSWTTAERDFVFLRLIDEILALNPVEAIIPIEGGDGVERGHIVTPKGVRGYFEKFGPKLAESQQRSERDNFGTGKSISWDETMEILSAVRATQST